jgi:hypothetical protein
MPIQEGTNRIDRLQYLKLMKGNDGEIRKKGTKSKPTQKMKGILYSLLFFECSFVLYKFKVLPGY